MPLARLGPVPPRLPPSQGVLGLNVGWGRRVGEVAPCDSSCDCALGTGASSLRCLDGARPSARCAQSRALGSTSRTAGTNSAEAGHHLPAPGSFADPATLSQRLLPGPGCAVRVAGSSAPGSLTTDSALGSDCVWGPGSSCVPRSPAAFGPRWFTTSPRARSGQPPPGPLLPPLPPPPVARGEGGDTAGEAGRGEGKRGARLDQRQGAVRCPTG